MRIRSGRLPGRTAPSILGVAALAGATALLGAAPVSAQQEGTPWTHLKRGSGNIEVLGHLPLGPHNNLADMDMEQDLERPFAYVARARYDGLGPVGTVIVDLSDPTRPETITEWQIENPELHMGGARDVKHFVWKGRHYVVQSFQFRQGGPDADLGAVVLDVTGLPDPAGVREVARIRRPDLPGGFHNIFVYKHSDGRVYLFTTVRGPGAHVYDLGTVVEEGPERAHVGVVPTPVPPEADTRLTGYHDLYLGYHPGSGQDRFYGGGGGGYYVYDVSDVRSPGLLATVTGVPGVSWGHTFTPTPDGRYAVAETEYQYAPLRIFDLRPALDGEVRNIRNPIAAWHADWRHLAHNHEMRWPFVFVSGYLDGLQVFEMSDPRNPRTVAYYDTNLESMRSNEQSALRGAFGVDVRNADGLIAVSDMTTGFWTFRMEGFQGWNGQQWGVPDVSSVQKWGEEGPGVPVSSPETLQRP